MYKVLMKCNACKKDIPDRDFTKARIIGVQKYKKGPWVEFHETQVSDVESSFALCPECFKKISDICGIKNIDYNKEEE